MKCDLSGLAARRRHDEYIPVAADLSREGKLRTVGRECRVTLFSWMGGQPLCVAPASLHRPEVAGVREHNVRLIYGETSEERRRLHLGVGKCASAQRQHECECELRSKLHFLFPPGDS